MIKKCRKTKGLIEDINAITTVSVAEKESKNKDEQSAIVKTPSQASIMKEIVAVKMTDEFEWIHVLNISLKELEHEAIMMADLPTCILPLHKEY